MVPVDRQPSEQHGRHRPAFGLALERSLAGLAGLKLCGGKCVVADDSIAIRRDENPRRAGSLGSEGVFSQPTIELRLSAGKARSVMPTLKRLGS